eukprot:3204342-Rhodomonas_salina.2
MSVSNNPDLEPGSRAQHRSQAGRLPRQERGGPQIRRRCVVVCSRSDMAVQSSVFFRSRSVPCVFSR